MIARIAASSVQGIDAFPVEVEVDVSRGLPSFTIVGLPDAACRESQGRVRSAIRASGYQFPAKITVNLAPADIKKEGSGYDLPIAIGILIASDQIASDGADQCVFAGELSLDGKVRPVTGMLCRASALVESPRKLVFSADNYNEAACVDGVKLHPVRTLGNAIAAIGSEAPPARAHVRGAKPLRKTLDFSEVKGQYFARRGIEVAAAGGHNLVMIGPPGSGKTMMAKRIPTVLLDLNFQESIQTTKVHSVAGLLKTKDSLIIEPPFRTPHHTISDSAMVGGGSFPRPGEISLAHNGVLFLDELPEFRRNVLEALRQPMEEGRIIVSRASWSLLFPSQFMLVGAMNPCPCGYFTDKNKECYCTPLQIKNYMGRISGPLLDRIDIHLPMSSLKAPDFAPGRPSESSETVKERVRKARERQSARYGQNSGMLNSRLEGKETEVQCDRTGEADDFLKKALQDLGFSGRAYHKILKVSRTIADLEGEPVIGLPHVQEAIGYRSLDRNSWFI